MSNFTLKQDGYAGYTAIPNCFIEQFMPYAAGEFVKIYIYLIKCINEDRSELSVSRIADAFNNTEKDVVRAFKYWQRKGLLKLTFDEDEALSSICLLNTSDIVEDDDYDDGARRTVSVLDAPVPGSEAANRKPSVLKRAKDKKEKEERSQKPGRYSIEPLSDNEEIRELVFVAERYLGRTLSGQDVRTILYLYDELEFPADLIEYLFEYCVSKKHKSIRYIEKTAIAWNENGINNVKAAKTMQSIYSDDSYQVLNAFGLGNRKPTGTESDFVSRWTLSYGFDLPIILKACSKTMDQIHQPSFEYTDVILRNWKNSGVYTLDDIKKLDEDFEQSRSSRNSSKPKTASRQPKTTSFNNFPQRNYDFEQLEQKLFEESRTD